MSSIFLDDVLNTAQVQHMPMPCDKEIIIVDRYSNL